MDMDNSVMVVEGRWRVKADKYLRGINGNGKNTIKINDLKSCLNYC